MKQTKNNAACRITGRANTYGASLAKPYILHKYNTTNVLFEGFSDTQTTKYFVIAFKASL